ncbi:acetylglutamate kinase [Chitinimonas prasina]|uniref:acetylglutamate kinase n=1 Tax=Chitinimonas prasina TaxID=1434937 RepID=A0ABQ5YID7_9NEIS|nr:acetylglutamate kinase [Chitinimonas prasina]GLR13448.1 acetylglutamate kinase [Chitinimonas prasina]
MTPNVRHFTGMATPAKANAQTYLQGLNADLLAGSLPFVQALQQQTVVVVFAGTASYDPAIRQTFAQDISLLAMMGAQAVLIHGGAPSFHAAGGASLVERVATQVTRTALAEINLELVRLINQHGPRAIGLAGQDGQLLRAAPPAAAGRAAEVATLDASLLQIMQANGLLPVIMPMAPDADGNDQLLVPEQIGSLLAQRLKANTLVLMVNGDVLHAVDSHDGLNSRAQLEVWLGEHSEALGATTVRAALDALSHGVSTVHLVEAGVPHTLLGQLLTEEGCGMALCHRSGASLLADSSRYFHDCDSLLRPDFQVERKRVVRF